MKGRHPRIGVDIDGTIANTHQVAVEEAAKQGYSITVEDLHEWNTPLGPGMDFNAVFYRTLDSPSCLSRVRPIEGARDGVLELNNLAETLFLTARHPRHGPETRLWLDRNMTRHIPLVMAEDKPCHCDLLIDDGPHNIEAMQEAGLPAIILDRPWNRHECPGVPRARSWPEAVLLAKQQLALAEPVHHWGQQQ